LEASALRLDTVNVVTQGAQAEMLEDMGAAEHPADEDVARELAQRSGATLVLFGVFEPAGDGDLTYQVRVLRGADAMAREYVAVTGTPAEAAEAVGRALARDLGLGSQLPPALVPAGQRGQLGYLACSFHAEVLVERTVVKGRKVTTPKSVLAACKDATADPRAGPSRGVVLAVQALSGDVTAVPSLRKHVASQVDDRLATMALARVLFDRAEPDAAQALLVRLSGLRPRDPDLWRMRGELHVQRAQWAEARAAFQRAVEEAPTSPYMRYRLSYASLQMGQPQDALSHARAALRLAGNRVPFYQVQLAERLLDVGRPAEAIPLLQQAVQAGPTRFAPRLRLGQAHLAARDADGAVRELTHAQRLKPAERDLERELDRVVGVSLARAHALRGDDATALALLRQLAKAGTLAPADLLAPEFAALKDTEPFRKLHAP
jgi:predicted Zn-dependent protease